MKIKLKVAECPFLNVRVEGAFKNSNGDVYMKIREIDYRPHNSGNQLSKANAINLEDCSFRWYDDNSPVVPINGSFLEE